MTAPTDEAVGGTFFEVFADLKLTLESVRDELKRANNIEQARLKRQARYVTMERMSDPGSRNGTAVDIVDFGAPQNGRIWKVRLAMAASSPDPSVTLAANVTWYVGQIMPAAKSTGLLPVTWSRDAFVSGASPLPQWRTYTDRVFTVLPNQHLIVGITAVPTPTTTSIALAVAVEDEPLWAAAQVIAVQ